MNFRSTADLDRALADGIAQLPGDLDLIAGIPRSGMLAATLLALHLNLPLTDLEGLLERRLLQVGARGTRGDADLSFEHVRKVLVLDDSVYAGSAMRKARARLAAAPLDFEVLFGAVFVAPEGTAQVDICFETVPTPRVFGWNVMHHRWLGKSCAGIDGVLSESYTSERTPRPLRLPSVPIGWLVTARPQSERAVTARWLADHGVRYGELVMRDREEPAAVFKARVFKKVRGILFLDGDADQAREIAERSGRPALCVATQEMFYPTSVTANAVALAAEASRPWRRAMRLASTRLLDRLLGRPRV